MTTASLVIWMSCFLAGSVTVADPEPNTICQATHTVDCHGPACDSEAESSIPVTLTLAVGGGELCTYTYCRDFTLVPQPGSRAEDAAARWSGFTLSARRGSTGEERHTPTIDYQLSLSDDRQQFFLGNLGNGGFSGWAGTCSASAPKVAAKVAAEVADEQSIRSHVSPTEAGELVVLQEVLVEAPIAAVWAAYTTEEGWAAWASPAVAIDLRAGGTIRTHYGEGASVGDPGTNTLHIVNYVPERLLTLRAELEERWPEVMKQDADRLMNVIVFEPLGEDRTKILSYGVGYRDTPAYDELMQFFIPANEGLFQRLKSVLEN